MRASLSGDGVIVKEDDNGWRIMIFYGLLEARIGCMEMKGQFGFTLKPNQSLWALWSQDWMGREEGQTLHLTNGSQLAPLWTLNNIQYIWCILHLAYTTFDVWVTTCSLLSPNCTGMLYNDDCYVKLSDLYQSLISDLCQWMHWWQIALCMCHKSIEEQLLVYQSLLKWSPLYCCV